MVRTIKDRYVYCADCGSRKEINGVCKKCGHVDVPLLPGMVPDITGLTQEGATALLTHAEAQLVVGDITTANSETVPVDKIISSVPDAGTQLEVGAAVAIVISLGPST